MNARYELDLALTVPGLSAPVLVRGTVAATALAVAAAAPTAPQPTPAPVVAPPEPSIAAPQPAPIDPSRYGKLTLPTDNDQDGSADEVPAAELPLSGGYQSEWFRMENGAAVFTVPVESDARTANAKYPRSELREQMVPRSDRINWLIAGRHVQRGTFIVDELPSGLGGAVSKTVAAQIHGVNAPPPIKVQVARNSAGRVYLYGIYNAAPAGDSFAGTLRDIALGEPVDYVIEVADNMLTLTVNGALLDRVDMAPWADIPMYFKAGNYVQNTAATATGRAVVRHTRLAVEHAAP